MRVDDMSLATFYVGDLWLGVSIDEVLEINRVAEITPVPGADREVLGVINLRGHLVSVVDLTHVLLGVERRADASCVNVILDANSESIGLRADRTGDVETYEHGEVQAVPGHLNERHGRFLRGILERNGEILALLDVASVLGGEV